MRSLLKGRLVGRARGFPDCLEDWIGEDNPVRVIEVFVDQLALAKRGSGGIDNPDPKYVSTSDAERSNLSIRMHTRRFTRLTTRILLCQALRAGRPMRNPH
jgi:hypothetical protein